MCVCVSKLRNRWGKIADDDDAVAKPMKERDRPGERVREQDRWAWPEFYLVFFAFRFAFGFIKVWPIKMSNDTETHTPNEEKEWADRTERDAHSGGASE